ncbi:hypothetical protein J6590_099448 [Homalodisca vitripennis]|nr:hypothetical protein J6590_099448 [Homalodisca vitripennis]
MKEERAHEMPVATRLRKQQAAPPVTPTGPQQQAPNPSYEACTVLNTSNIIGKSVPKTTNLNIFMKTFISNEKFQISAVVIRLRCNAARNPCQAHCTRPDTAIVTQPTRLVIARTIFHNLRGTLAVTVSLQSSDRGPRLCRNSI